MSPGFPGFKNMKCHIFPILIIVVISLAIYANTLNNGFVYDDGKTVVDNHFIKDINNLSKLVQKKYFTLSGETTYRPVVTLTYFIDYALYGLRPSGYHLTNILLNAANGALFYIFLTLLLPPSVGNHRVVFLQMFKNPPLIISLLFVTHPVLTEAVNAISFREDLLVFFFYFLTLIIYLRLRLSSTMARPYLNSLYYLLSCLTYYLAILSKEMAATLPLIICCYEWVCGSRKKPYLWAILSDRYNIGYLFITASYIYLRFYFFYNPDIGHLSMKELPDKLLNIPFLYSIFLKISMFPISLSADYVRPIPVKTFFSFLVILSFLALTLSGFLVVWLRRKRKEVTFGILFFFTTLIPVYNIITIYHSISERYLYLPVSGLCIAIGMVILSEKRYRNRDISRILNLTIFIMLLIFSTSVISRNGTWKDDYMLWSDTIKKMPNSWIAHNNLGNAYAERKEFDKAISQYRTAIGLRSDKAEFYINIGAAYADTGRPDEAILAYSTALKLKPNNPLIHYNLANTYSDIGQIDKALLAYDRAIQLNSKFTEARYNLGMTYLKMGLKDKAQTEFEIVSKLRLENPTSYKRR